MGAENATHAEHYTGASASHIRALLREEGLGLGASIGKVNAETFGLSLFSGVLGRLNGKSDVEVQKHQHALRDAGLRMYQAQKYGNMNFVSGGFLVGDRIEHEPEDKVAVPTKKSKDAVADTSPHKKDSSEVDSAAVEPQRKRRKKDVKESKAVSEVEESSERSQAVGDEIDETRTKRKDSKKSKKSKKPQSTEDEETAEDVRSRRKQERRARREERRRRKEGTRRQRSNDNSRTATPTASSELDILSETPTSKQSAGMFAGNRHAVRQRYIQQKRMASMDPKAINEIFMLQPAPTPA